MTSERGISRDDASPSIIIIRTRAADGARTLERQLDRFSGGRRTGNALMEIGPDEWVLARAVQKALRTRCGDNDGIRR